MYFPGGETDPSASPARQSGRIRRRQIVPRSGRRAGHGGHRGRLGRPRPRACTCAQPCAVGVLRCWSSRRRKLRNRRLARRCPTQCGNRDLGYTQPCARSQGRGERSSGRAAWRGKRHGGVGCALEGADPPAGQGMVAARGRFAGEGADLNNNGRRCSTGVVANKVGNPLD